MFRLKSVILPLFLVVVSCGSPKVKSSYNFDQKTTENTVTNDTLEISDTDTLIRFAEKQMELIISNKHHSIEEQKETKRLIKDLIRENRKLKSDNITLSNEILFKSDTIDSLKVVNFDTFYSLMQKNKEIESINYKVKKLNNNLLREKKLHKITKNELISQVKTLQDSIETIYEVFTSSIRPNKVDKIFSE